MIIQYKTSQKGVKIAVVVSDGRYIVYAKWHPFERWIQEYNLPTRASAILAANLLLEKF